jgi:hypothetical protein
MFTFEKLLIILTLNVSCLLASNNENCFFYETIRLTNEGVCTRDALAVDRLYCRSAPTSTSTDADGWMTLESNHHQRHQQQQQQQTDDELMELTIACDVEGEACARETVVRRRRAGVVTRPACVAHSSSSFDFFTTVEQ